MKRFITIIIRGDDESKELFKSGIIKASDKDLVKIMLDEDNVDIDLLNNDKFNIYINDENIKHTSNILRLALYKRDCENLKIVNENTNCFYIPDEYIFYIDSCRIVLDRILQDCGMIWQSFEEELYHILRKYDKVEIGYEIPISNQIINLVDFYNETKKEAIEKIKNHHNIP